MSKDIPLEIAIRSLQRMFLAFTGRPLPETKAKELIEQTRNEPA